MLHTIPTNPDGRRGPGRRAGNRLAALGVAGALALAPACGNDDDGPADPDPVTTDPIDAEDPLDEPPLDDPADPPVGQDDDAETPASPDAEMFEDHQDDPVTDADPEVPPEGD